MSESGQQESDQKSSTKQPDESNSEVKVTKAWEQSSKELINQHQNKFDAFKAIADQTGTIDESHFSIGGEQKSEIFKRFDADHDGKITQQEWNQGWNNLDVQFLETQHKVAIAQQKLQILDALEGKVEPGLNISQKSYNQSHNMVDRFKKTSTLGDLTDIFNKKSSYNEQEEYQDNYQFDLKQKGNNRPLDQLLQQFKTPNKTDMFVETGSGSGQYKGSNKQTQKFGFVQGSASPGFNPTNFKNDNQYNSKIQQQMNINIDMKDKNKSNKRREELTSYMGKLGLGGNESIQKTTISIEQPNSNVFERMKVYVNNIGCQHSRTQSQPGPGLDGLVNDKQFSTSTFKQQLKQYRKERGGEQPENLSAKFSKPSNFIENPLLQDQSLKSFHLKLMHQQGALNNNKYTRI
ncbi:unnamed protein product [Paramecium sonneborni]|uniref:EF-hand domain-containing protein n=1 Tax=Paramecium sonneborni TaxID=65129 RepID=A0A8S1KVK9_9CILI|nr:unnamed protein product [Paramecium sonneborni]